MNKRIGIIASGATRNKITILSDNPIKTDFVTVYDETKVKKTIYEIISVEAENERLKDYDYFRLMTDNDDYRKYNIYKAEARAINSIVDGKMIHDRFHIGIPGTYVEVTDYNDIEWVNDIQYKNGRERVGKLVKCENVNVFLDFSEIFSTHCCIVGRTGCGKSYFITNLLKKMRMNYLVISPTDEYDYLNVNNRIINCDNYVINFDLAKFKKIFELNNTELEFLTKYVKSVKHVNRISSVEFSEDIYDYYKEEEEKAVNNQYSYFFDNNINGEVKRYSAPKFVLSLCKKLSENDYLISFGRTDFSPDTPIICNTQGMSNKMEEIFVYCKLMSILEDRIKNYKSNQINNNSNELLLIIEEAHNYAPSVKSTICKDAIIQISRVGRKYGLHLVVLSQRPRFIDQTLLSQCGSNFVFNLPNPDDVDYIMSASNFYNPVYKETIQNFDVGECLITSNKRASDIICKIDF